ncbi:MAG: Zn-dependent hydrolase [Sphingomonadales bacterium]|nr:Zn-dependent hydrolase [Sphingomonadales bacterium]
MEKLRVNEQRLWLTHVEMGKIGALPNGGCCRLALSDEDKMGRDLFIRWSREAGCEIRIDAAGNIFARRPGLDNSLPAVATGSHLDTQPHAGLYDGIYGVLAGLEVFRTLNDAGIETQAPLENIVWTNEECVRFSPPTSGSMVFTEQLGIAELHQAKTTDGTTVGQDLQRLGYLGDHITMASHKIGCFIEAHIEQGPILEQQNKTIGAVTGIQGARMFEVRVTGQDNHAGTTPMPLRRDALTGATRMVLWLNELVADQGDDIRLTIGRFNVSPNSASTVPGAVTFQIDLRHPQMTVLNALEDRIRMGLAEKARQAGLGLTIKDICAFAPVAFDGALVAMIEAQAVASGYSVMRMLSGAAHDAGNLAALVPTAMIFVPCEKGISHNEAERATPGDLAAGANVLLYTMLSRAG